MGSYLEPPELELALSRETCRELFDDDRDGEADEDAMAQVIELAEAEVNSRLASTFPTLTLPVTPNSPMSSVLKKATLLFAIPESFLRHPEYVRTFGENPRGEAMHKRAERMMDRICKGEVRLFDVPNAPDPATVGATLIESPVKKLFEDDDGNYQGDF